ncbi:hypothetical protein PR048_016221 [Dryococelus australis]|uniref:PiggyBac transposable element-derived protein domain-containing protein n=1 Tax=Dryococelus australis TaxID=614101 RepID=A0ABQ9HJI9_9NEOP|nr:hypothetical protein PR048_016221 [Dryococelus australis]
MFFAIIIHICPVKKARLGDFWVKKSILCTPFPSSVMSRDRFKAVLSNFHLNDNNFIILNQPNHGPLFKLRSFLDHLLQAFPASFVPYSNGRMNLGDEFISKYKKGNQKSMVSNYLQCVILVLGMFCEWKYKQANVHKRLE